MSNPTFSIRNNTSHTIKNIVGVFAYLDGKSGKMVHFLGFREPQTLPPGFAKRRGIVAEEMKSTNYGFDYHLEEERESRLESEKRWEAERRQFYQYFGRDLGPQPSHYQRYDGVVRLDFRLLGYDIVDLEAQNKELLRSLLE